VLSLYYNGALERSVVFDINRHTWATIEHEQSLAEEFAATARNSPKWGYVSQYRWFRKGVLWAEYPDCWIGLAPTPTVVWHTRAGKRHCEPADQRFFPLAVPFLDLSKIAKNLIGRRTEA